MPPHPKNCVDFTKLSCDSDFFYGWFNGLWQLHWPPVGCHRLSIAWEWWHYQSGNTVAVVVVLGVKESKEGSGHCKYFSINEIYELKKLFFVCKMALFLTMLLLVLFVLLQYKNNIFTYLLLSSRWGWSNHPYFLWLWKLDTMWQHTISRHLWGSLPDLKIISQTNTGEA